jgi:hypothetical protein
MSRLPHLERSAALWNREYLELRSDEVLAQILDRGEIEAWRELYALARSDAELRRRILGVVKRVPLPFPHFWLAALANLGESVDLGMALPRDDGDLSAGGLLFLTNGALPSRDRHAAGTNQRIPGSAMIRPLPSSPSKCLTLNVSRTAGPAFRAQAVISAS